MVVALGLINRDALKYENKKILNMKTLLIVTALFMLNGCDQQTISYKEISQRTDQSKEVAEKFAALLKDELEKAMKAGGPIQAIGICHEQAPKITQQLSAETGWDIHRTSLKSRATQADAWEKSMLLSFEQRHKDGDKFKSLFNQDVVEVNGKASFRYIQAIETKEMCLACHGENIAPEMTEKIAQLYPDDRAVGFKAGDIRGAFSIIQPLD